jgi:hypothetical protein
MLLSDDDSASGNGLCWLGVLKRCRVDFCCQSGVLVPNVVLQLTNIACSLGFRCSISTPIVSSGYIASLSSRLLSHNVANCNAAIFGKRFEVVCPRACRVCAVQSLLM